MLEEVALGVVLLCDLFPELLQEGRGAPAATCIIVSARMGADRRALPDAEDFGVSPAVGTGSPVGLVVRKPLPINTGVPAVTGNLGAEVEPGIPHPLWRTEAGTPL